jgi:hypothetical protein
MNKEKLKKIPHIFSATIILFHSYERFETEHSSYLVFLFLGLIFLALAIFHHKIAHRIPYIDIVFYAIESMLSLIIAYEYYNGGKKGLPIMYLIACLFQLFAMYKFMSRSKKIRHDTN